MSREIKFRGFSYAKKSWLYGNLIEKEDPTKAEPTPWVRLIHDRALSAEMVVFSSVGQYTGLKDKNSKEIFEGDIIKFKYYNVFKRWWSNLEQIPIIEQECNQQRSEVKEKLTTVVYNDGCYILKDGYPVTLVDVARGQRFKTGQTSHCDTEEKQWDFEVIGNIYENPELLK